jgi:peptide/nickel transport system permease protein
MTAVLSRARSSTSSLGVLGSISLFIIVFGALLALVGPWIAPHDPGATAGPVVKFMSADGHLLGYDANGRDVFSRLLAGARTAMVGPFVVVIAAMTAGVVIALASAWFGGRFDSIVGATLDVMFSFPGLLLAILAAAVFGAGIASASITLAIAFTPYIARVVRGAAIQERSKPYVDALVVQGMSAPRVCVRHLLPNVRGLIVAQATTLFGYAMVDLAAISFIGLGVQAPDPDWGVMVSENREGLAVGHPWPSVLPGLCLIVVVIAFGILGERLTDAQGSDR